MAAVVWMPKASCQYSAKGSSCAKQTAQTAAQWLESADSQHRSMRLSAVARVGALQLAAAVQTCVCLSHRPTVGKCGMQATMVPASCASRCVHTTWLTIYAARLLCQQVVKVAGVSLLALFKGKKEKPRS
jgi:hypothetical protein